jgi:hypothetical protein
MNKLAGLALVGLSVAGLGGVAIASNVVSEHDRWVAIEQSDKANLEAWQAEGADISDRNSVGTQEAIEMILSGDIQTVHMGDEVIQISQLPSFATWKDNVKQSRAIYDLAFETTEFRSPEFQAMIESAPGTGYEQFSGLSFLSEVEQYGGFVDDEGNFYLNHK